MSFAAWMEQQKRLQDSGSLKEDDNGFMGGFNSVQESMAAQMQELSGVLPDVNGLTGIDFRRRMQQSVHLLLVSAGFAALAVFVGLPTIVLKPSKFVLCLSLSTMSAFASVVILQRPSVFLSNLLDGGFARAKPVIALFMSVIFTIYTISVTRKYAFVVLAGGTQVLAILFFLSSFIPGGAIGLSVLFRSSSAVIHTCVTFLCRYVKSFISQVID